MAETGVERQGVLERARFASNRLFAGISPEAVEQLCIIPRAFAVDAGTMVFDEGDPANELYLIASGRVRISKRGRGGEQETLNYLGPDDYFGEMALFESAPRSARATAVERTVLGRVDFSAFERILLEAPPQFHLNLTSWAVHRLRENDRLLIDQLLSSERLSMIGSMAAMMLHDFKNPISVIRGATELLQETSHDPAVGHLTGMIVRSVDSMLSMIQELLDYSRGNSDLRLETVPVTYLMAELESQALGTMEGRGVRVERDVRLAGHVRADPVRLVRALLNIINNAGDVLQAGGALRLIIERDGGWVRFTISDNGPGIPQELLPRIFEPFVSKGKSHGTGLGLTIAKAAIDAHGGSIAVESAPGVGTTFTIRLPATDS